jgi:hypothetical protein
MLMARADAQSYWDGTFSFVPVTNMNEVTHVFMIGKPGQNQGKVLFWRDYTGNTANGSPKLWIPGSTSAPTAGTVQDNVFCACHGFDVDGDLIVFGGERNGPCNPLEPNWTYVVDPASFPIPFTRVTDLLAGDPPHDGPPGHYYPSSVVRDDGRIVQVGGGRAPWNSDPPPAGCGPTYPMQWSNWYQVFDKATGKWEGKLPGAPNDTALLGLPPAAAIFKYYPLTHLLSSGHLFVSVTTNGAIELATGRRWSPSALLDLSGGWPGTPWAVHPSQLTNTSGQVIDLFYPTAFLWPWTSGQQVGTDKIVLIGGWDTNRPYNQQSGSPAESTVWQITSPQLGGSWSRTALPPLNHPRVYANVTLLPDLSAIVMGGSRNFSKAYNGVAGGEVCPDPVYEPEILDLSNPSAGWQVFPANPTRTPRTYHAASVLLPDGRVGWFGGYREWAQLLDPATQLPLCPQIPPNTDVEIFRPPYLQFGIDRPILTSAPTTVGYGSSIVVTVTFSTEIPGDPADEIDFATLIRCGSVTHHFDWDQRCLKLDVIGRQGAQVTLHSLPSADPFGRGEFIVPPGWYMLFVVRKLPPQPGPQVRVPSVARFIQVR